MQSNETNTNTVLTSAALSSIRDVAKNAQDVEKWFASNLHLVGLPTPEKTEHAEVGLGFSVRDSLTRELGGAPVVKAYVSISLTNFVKIDPSLARLLQTDTIVNSSASTNFRMYMSFDAWPFLTAHMAILALDNYLGDKPAEIARAEELLTRYIPHHFPGLSWEALKGLHSNELLPMIEEGALDEPALLDLLFSRRTTSDSPVNLPETLSA